MNSAPLYYGYTPTLYVSIVFLVLFLISTLVCFGCWLWFGLPPVMWPIILCGVAEIMGCAARLDLSLHPQRMASYQLQLETILTGPTLLAHATLILLTVAIENLCGSSWGPSSSHVATAITGANMIAFIAQSVGAAVAGNAFKKSTDPSLGRHIMLAGTIIHLATIVLACLRLAACFTRHVASGRIHRNVATEFDLGSASIRSGPRLPPRYVWTLLGLVSCMAFILTRLAYRIAELSDSLGGRFMISELYFNILDGTMVLLAMTILNILFATSFVHLQRIEMPDDKQNAVIA